MMMMMMMIIRSTSFDSVSTGQFSSRDLTTIPTSDDSTDDNNDYDMSLVLLPTANSPTATPIDAATNGPRVYVHLPSSTLILLLVLVSIYHVAIPTKFSSDDFASAIIYNDSNINSLVK